MPRIPDEELERLKTDITLERLIEACGVSLKKQGKELVGLCPFHDDKEPSLVVSPDKNLWHCLGACNTGGSTIDWVMKSQGVSFRHAVELLRSDQTPLAANLTPGKPVKRSRAPKLPMVLDSASTVDEQKLLNRVIDFYHQSLLQSPEALAYLKKRGLHHPGMIKTFKLGYANRSLGYRLPNSHSKQGRELRAKLKQAGILRQNGYEHFSGSLVIPVLSESGQVREIYGRKIGSHLNKSTPRHLYLPGPHGGVFNETALTAHPEIILCESLIDALTFWCAGYQNVTTCYGVSGFSTEHLQAFKKAGTERVLMAFDHDDAGNSGAEKVAKTLQQAGLDCYRIRFPKKMDANDYAVTTTPADKSLGLAIRSAQWMGNGQAPERESGMAETLSSLVAKPHDEQEPKETLAVQENTVSKPYNGVEPLPPVLMGPPRPQGLNLAPLPAERIPETPDVLLKPSVKRIGQVEELYYTLGARCYRVRGLESNKHLNQLKVNLQVSGECALGGQGLHVDILDLYQSRLRAAFIKQAAMELGVKERVIKTDLAKLMLSLEARVGEQLSEAEQQGEDDKTGVAMSDEQRMQALALLKSPDLLTQILSDYETCGLVGEQSNKLLGYLATVSRKLDNPLAILVLSSSSAGKSTLMDAVLSFMPKEEQIRYSAMTGQSLYYLGEKNIQHKILAISEEEGVRQASYALKLLQSEGELSIASTAKNATTGQLETQEYCVKGPVMLFLTSTAIDIDEELQNRCLVLTVNEEREQTEAIHALQRHRRTLQGWNDDIDRQRLIEQHQNAQRLLKPLPILNPYAGQLTFLSDKTRTRRDHEKYLTLIESIALLHQYQREVKTHHYQQTRRDYIEVSLSDIEQANALAHEILGRSLDELPPQTRNLLMKVKTYVQAQCKTQDLEPRDYRFSRRELRVHTGMSDTQLRVHLKRLVELEYLVVHQGARGKSFVYELLYDGNGQVDTPHLMGLIDVEKLKRAPAASTSRGVACENAGATRGQNGPDAGSTRRDENARQAKQVNGYKLVKTPLDVNKPIEEQTQAMVHTP